MEPKSEVHKRRPRRRNLRTNTNHDPFILKFPPEIASHIFCLSMTKYDYEPNHFLLPTPFILGSVSQGWRQLAWSTPQLWSTISFTLVKPPPKKIALLQLINDWLLRSRSLPLDLWIYDYRGYDLPMSQEQCRPIINALNQHSGRWHALYLSLSAPSFPSTGSFFHLFCGTSPPSNLRSLQLINKFNRIELPAFRMNSRPSPTHLTIQNFPVLNIDIMWDSLKHLKMWETSLGGSLELMRRTPHLQSCSLLSRVSSALPTAVLRHMGLRKLELFESPVFLLIDFLKSIELPSLEEYHYHSHKGDILSDSVVSLLKRSGSRLKVLNLELEGEEPAMEDINNLRDAVPYLQEFQLELRRPGPKTAFVMDDLFIQLSLSPPALEGGAPGLLPDLQLYSGEGYMFDCIPDIFSWPHRKTLSLQVEGSRKMVVNDDISHKISKLINQGFKIRILKDGGNHFSHHSLH